MAQVQKVLRNLVLEGCLEQEHIALLWDLTEKVRMSLEYEVVLPRCISIYAAVEFTSVVSCNL